MIAPYRSTMALISAAVLPLLDPIEDFGSYGPFSDILVLTPSVLCGTMVSEERFRNEGADRAREASGSALVSGTSLIFVMS